MTPTTLRRLAAPAKLNLFLHVTGRRADGYHELETVFELIDLSDELDFERNDVGRIERVEGAVGVPPESDLCVRAARLLASESGTRSGVRISVRKRIPMGAGLGGGSSDAATTLLALNRLWGLDWPPERLAAIGLQLGADVPVFLHGHPAYATGVGESLTPLEGTARTYVLACPDIHVATAAVFAAPELTRDTKPIKIVGLSRGWSVFRGKNDLESVVLGRYPQVAACLEGLRTVARALGLDAELARMTGSGASVFLPVHGEAMADQACAQLRSLLDRGTLREVMTVRSLARHPLRDWAYSRTVPDWSGQAQ